MQKKLVGLTGGTGCGQSQVGKILQERYGVQIVSMDAAGRSAIEEHPDVHQRLRQIFGNGVFDDLNNVDRRKLGDLVFKDADEREKLNQIVHPVMLQIVREEMAAAVQRPWRVPYVVVDGALIFELKMEREMDVVVVVTASERTRIQRIMQRDELTEESVRQRMSSQLPIAEKVRRADHVIENDGSIRALQKKVVQLHRWLVRKTANE